MFGQLSFLLGFFSTLEIFKYKLGVFHIYPVDLFFYILLIITGFKVFLNKGYINVSFKSQYAVQIFIAFILYYIVSLNYYMPIFDQADDENILRSIKYLIKMIILLVFILLIMLSDQKQRITFAKKFINGFFISILFHALYSSIILVTWYITFNDINVNIMNSLGVTSDSIGHTLTNYLIMPIIRVSGFHWDPAYFGLWGIIGIFIVLLKYNRKFIKIILFNIIFLPWLMTFSRTAYFTFISILFSLIIVSVIKKHSTNVLFCRSNKNIVLVNIIIILILCFGGVSFINNTDDDVSIKEIFKYLTDRELESSLKHLSYPQWAFESIVVDPAHFIFGFGNRNSGRGLAFSNISINDKYFVNNAYDIETDMFKILVNGGMIGFCVHIIWHMIIIGSLILRKYKDIELHKYALIVLITISSSFIAGIFYVYNDSKWLWLFYLCGMIIIFQNDYQKQMIK